MAENPLTKLPLPGQIGVGALVAGIIGGLFYYFVYMPGQEDLAKKGKTLEGLQKENRELQAAAANLPQLQQKVKALEAQLDILKSILPPAKETPDLMKQVQYLATQSNLLIKIFAPGAAVTKEFYQEWPIKIDVEGSYHNLGAFFDKVGRLRRLVNVGGLKIRSLSTQTMTRTVSASCVATTYVYVESTAPAKPPAKK